jgi:hypothetical protein
MEIWKLVSKLGVRFTINWLILIIYIIKIKKHKNVWKKLCNEKMENFGMVINKNVRLYS